MDPSIPPWELAEANAGVYRPSGMLQLTPEVEEPEIFQRKLVETRVAVYLSLIHI